MSCSQFYGRVGTLFSTPTSRTYGVQGGANDTRSESNISSSRSRESTPVSRSNRSLEEKVDSLLKAAQEQKEENLALKSQLKALEEKIENSGQNQATTVCAKNKRIPPSLSVRLSVMC